MKKTSILLAALLICLLAFPPASFAQTAAQQIINGVAGMLLGGGNQIYISEVNPKWFN